MYNHEIILKKVKVHNLKNITLTLKPFELIVFTGVSGSGKSSLAFDTIYIEGQRRYIESLPHSNKRYLKELKKPDAEEIFGISPTIAIEQKSLLKSPRSTAGTITGIYDYLRVLFAKIGIRHCPESGNKIQTQSKEQILKEIESLPKDKQIILLAPYAKNKKASFKEDFKDLLSKGFLRVRVDQKILELSDLEEIDPKKPHNVDIVIDRFMLKDQSRLKEAVSTALQIGNGFFSILDRQTNEEMNFSEHAYCFVSKKSYSPLDPSHFSFNHPKGMCERCQGLGIAMDFDLDKIIDPDKSIAEDTCKIAGSYKTIRYKNIYDNLAKIYDFNIRSPWKKLPEKAKHAFLYGTEKKWVLMRFTHPVKNLSWKEYVAFEGVLKEAKKRLQKAKSEHYKQSMEKYMIKQICPDCKGSRLKPYPSATTISGKKINEITSLTIEESLHFFNTLHLSPLSAKIAKEPVKEIQKRLQYLINVGLHYLTLDRKSSTLSGGEAQRVHLAAQIGSGLVGATYILDEPSIGLHPQDHHLLLNTLLELRDKKIL